MPEIRPFATDKNVACFFFSRLLKVSLKEDYTFKKVLFRRTEGFFDKL